MVDSTPVECGRSRPTAKRSQLAGWAGYGYCASHSRYFWGLRLHVIATPSGLPIAFALANPKIDEREIGRDLLDIDPALRGARTGQTLIADKGYRSKEFDAVMAQLFRGRLTAIIDDVLPLKDGAAAQRRLAEGKQFGKLVLKP